MPEDGGLDLLAALRQLERARDRREHELGLDDGREVHEDGPAAHFGRERLGGGECEARLAGSPRSGQRHEPHVVASQQRFDGGDLEPTADERGRGSRQPDPACGLRLRRRRETGVVAQDRALELLKRRPWLDPELLDERASCALVRLQRVLLPPRAVQRENLLLAQPFSVRLVGDQLLELREQGVVAAELEPGVVPKLQCAEPQLLEALGRHTGPGLVGEVGQRRARPQGEGRVEIVGGVCNAFLRERALGLTHEALETRQVELGRLELDPVAVAVRLDALGADRAPQAVHVDLEGRAGRGRRVVPQGVHEVVARQHGAAVQEQLCQERTLLRPAERQHAPLRQRLDGPENRKFCCSHPH